MDFSKRYSNLNNEQRKAVDAIDGPVMVVAGPGTGKTELLGVRVANIIKTTDTLPENILCLTFTDSGANAMRERLVQIIGKEAYKVAIHTFHSFGSEIINQNGQYFYNGANFKKGL
jgi:DNA helicase-2/ATP-dependent DNA helicase PcrA